MVSCPLVKHDVGAFVYGDPKRRTKYNDFGTTTRLYSLSPWIEAYNDLVPTIQDVARLAGVSPSTAKRALKEPEKLTPQTLTRVQEAIEKLHYEPDIRAGSLRGGQSRTVGLIVGSIVEPFFAQFARTATQVLGAAGYAVIISENEYSSARELDELRLLYGQRVAGILVRSGYGGESRDYLHRLAERGVCIVEFDYTYPLSPFPSVMLDNPEAVRTAVLHLYSQGHRHIAALGNYDPVIHPEERSRTFPQAMNALGLTVPIEYQRVMILTEETAYRLTHELLDLPNPPTALLALTGTQAIGAYRAIRERNLRIPKDLSLVAFDNYPWTELVDPPVTVVEQPVDDMATASAKIMISCLEGKVENKEYKRQVFKGKLIVRQSCRKV